MACHCHPKETFSPTSYFLLLSLLLGVSFAGSGDVCAAKAVPEWCPVKCFRTDPVCGVDGVTYWCGCRDAQCAGVKVAKLGFCNVGSGGGGGSSFSAQALLLMHIVWLVLLGFSVIFGLL